MNTITLYLITSALILMVLRQVREHPLDLRSMAGPVIAVGVAAVMFLHSIPTGGNDLLLEVAGVLAGAAFGACGGLATTLRIGRGRRGYGRAGLLAAGLWVGRGAAPLA